MGRAWLPANSYISSTPLVRRVGQEWGGATANIEFAWLFPTSGNFGPLPKTSSGVALSGCGSGFRKRSGGCCCGYHLSDLGLSAAYCLPLKNTTFQLFG